jgi:hypothetical protein
VGGCELVAPGIPGLVAGRFPAGALWMRIPAYAQLDSGLQSVWGEIALFFNSTLTDQSLNPASWRGSKNLEAIWPPDRAGKPLDASKPLTIASHRILILRRVL